MVDLKVLCELLTMLFNTCRPDPTTSRYRSISLLVGCFIRTLLAWDFPKFFVHKKMISWLLGAIEIGLQFQMWSWEEEECWSLHLGVYWWKQSRALLCCYSGCWSKKEVSRGEFVCCIRFWLDGNCCYHILLYLGMQISHDNKCYL